MTRISLVCSIHKELGTAKPSWLCQLLLELKPDVIFLEVSPADFGDFYKTYKRSSLESLAIRQYREGNPVRLEPVDLNVRTRDFCEQEDQMFGRILSESPSFRGLTKTHIDRVIANGFFYLNSQYNDNHWDEALLEMQRTVERLDNSDLRAFFDLWKQTNANRENAMLQTIQNFCKQHPLANGLFLIGSAHRKSILDFFSRTEEALGPPIKWGVPKCFQSEG
jgi:hypothetical protein